MKRYLTVALALLVAGASLSVASAAKKNKKGKHQAAKIQLLTVSDSTSYTAGYVLAQMVRDRFLGGLAADLSGTADSLRYAVAYQGLFDALVGDTTLFTPTSAERLLDARVAAVHKVREQQAMAAGKRFLEENARRDSVTVLPSGLQYQVLKAGNGPVARADQKVKVIYEGRLIDGTVFDSTARHGGQPATFAPGQVIKGWTEALTKMPAGSKWRLFIPQELGYGSRATGSIPAYSTLIFDVEVLEVLDK